MPKYYIKTYGCQMNVNDSERIAGLLEYAGLKPLDKFDIMDPGNKRYSDLKVILVNACSVREAAESRALQFLASLAQFKKRHKNLIIGLCGCVSSFSPQELKKKYPFVDIVFGPGEVARLAEFLRIKDQNSPKREKGPTAWVTIMEGCDNFCSYCVVPYVRGRERSRSSIEIIKEVNELDRSVFKEVVLLGQNVNSYKYGSGKSEVGSGLGSKKLGLGNLLQEVHKIEGIQRIRFLTSHPRDMSSDIIKAVKELPKVCEYFHIPLQAGDDRVLKAMNRGYTAKYYRELVAKIRKILPDATVTSDVMVGFPGETDKEFKNTCRLIEKAGLDYVNTFSYSLRSGTIAAKLKDQVPENIKKNRLEKIMKVVKRTALKRNKPLVGKTVEIMVERPGSGRTRGNKLVHFRSNGPKPGDTIYVRITKAGPWVLEGKQVS
jgi:tRNA-2-methylthio-N6-dimethylallyladenosine synthase